MWEQKRKSDPEEEHTFTAVTNPEQEKFYRDVNQVVDRNRFELTVLEGYGKFRFWKAFFGSPFVYIPLMLAFLGLTAWADKVSTNASDFTTRLLMLSLLGSFIVVAALIVWKLISWPIRFLFGRATHRSAVDYVSGIMVILFFLAFGLYFYYASH
jgi:hypothetical protein